MPKKKKFRGPIIKIRKLGKEKAWGTAWTEGRYSYINLDPRLGALRFLETAVHEQAHISLPDFSERQIDRLGKDISKTLWRLGFRRVLAEPHSTPTRISK